MARLGRSQPSRSSGSVHPAIIIRAPKPATGGTRIPPVYGTPAETTWAGTAATKDTTSISWNAGDLIAVLALTANVSCTLVPTAAGLTFLPQGTAVTTASSCWGHRWVATAASPGSGVVTLTRSGTADSFGAIAYVLSGSDGAGATAATAAAAQTLSLATTLDNSAVLEVVGDWGAGSVAGHTWTPAGQTEREASTDAGLYTVYAADWADRGTAGTVSYGVSVTASGSNYTKVVLEILGTTATSGGSLPVLTAPPAPAAGIAAPAPILTVSRDVTPLQASASPPAAFVPPAGGLLLAAPPTILFRSTADPVSSDVPRQAVITQPSPAPAQAPAASLAARRVETVPMVPPDIISVATTTMPRPAATPLLVRSTADPVAGADTPPAPIVARTVTTALVAAPASTVLASRDVTALQPSSNPAGLVIGRAPWSTTAPPAVQTRLTADPVSTDSPTTPTIARAGAVAYPAPSPVLAVSRDVTPLQPSASPPPPVLAALAQARPAPVLPLLTRPTADPAAGTDTPTAALVVRAGAGAILTPGPVLYRSITDAATPTPVTRLVTVLTVRPIDLPRGLCVRSMPPPVVERRTDGVLITAPPRPPDAARAWLLTPRAEPTTGPAPKAGRIEPGTRAYATAGPGLRLSPGAGPGSRGAAGAGPGTHGQPTAAPGTRTSPTIEGGA